MQSEESFELASPLEQVWAALVDVERITPCVPGASITRHNEDGSYDGEFKVKIGPTAASYEGRLTVEQIDEDLHATTLQLAGTDKRGQGGARATVTTTATASPDGTRISIASDYSITGRLARFGRGGTIDEIAAELVAQFADALRRLLADGNQETVELSALAESDLGGPPVAGEPVAPEEPVMPEETIVPEQPALSEATPALEELTVSEVPPAVAAEAPAAETPAAEAPAAETPPAPSWTPPPPPAGGEVVPSGLLSRARAHPGPLAAAVLGFLVALRVLRRRS